AAVAADGSARRVANENFSHRTLPRPAMEAAGLSWRLNDDAAFLRVEVITSHLLRVMADTVKWRTRIAAQPNSRNSSSSNMRRFDPIKSTICASWRAVKALIRANALSPAAVRNSACERPSPAA